MSAESSTKMITAHTPWTVFLVFLRLGFISFGGPIAHLGYFREEFVVRRQWLSERSYIDLVALCQFLPGPASSQVGIGLGLSRAGFSGAVAAWAGFTLPSAIILVLFAQGMSAWGNAFPSGLLHGLKIVAVAVVAQAVWGMARNICTDVPRVTIAVFAACAALIWPNAWGQIAVIICSAVIGLMLFKPAQQHTAEPLPISVSRKVGLVSLVVFFGLLVGLPFLIQVWPSEALAMTNAFFRAGSLVFGGGACCTTVTSVCDRIQRMGNQRHIHCWVWLSTGRTGPALYLRSISRSVHERPTLWLDRSYGMPGRYLRTFIPTRNRRAAILGATTT